MTLAAGILNRRVLLQRRIESPTGTGGTTVTWQDIATVWVNIRVLNGTETVKADFPVSVARASIRMRLRNDIDATCRAVYTSGATTTIFEILAVLPDLVGREFMDLAVQEGLTNG